MRRRSFIAGAAALAASPALPVGPVVAGEGWAPEVLSKAGTMFATNAEAMAGTAEVYWLSPEGFMVTTAYKTAMEKLTNAL